jgi:GTP-binding protein
LLNFKYKSKFSAAHGQRGGSSCKHGKAGADLTIKVPVGTIIKDLDRKAVIVDLSKAGMRVLVAEGGKGGRGNAAFATPTRRAPYFCEPGQPGVNRHLELELKLLADVGLVGFPNAGKSTLLAAMSQAKPKIAPYPFSTLEPNLGVVRKSNGDGYVMADIPGLIEGAARGVGLGHDFLRHIERTRLLLHIVDVTSEKPQEQIDIINRELNLFSSYLSKMEQLIVLNKIDAIDEAQAQTLRERISLLHPEKTVLAISAAARLGLDKLAQAIENKLAGLAKSEEVATDQPILDENAFVHQDDGFMVSRRRQNFIVQGDKISRLVQVTDSKSPESLHHLNQVLKHMGVIDELIKQQIKVGSEVQIGTLSFTYGEDLF